LCCAVILGKGPGTVKPSRALNPRIVWILRHARPYNSRHPGDSGLKQCKECEFTEDDGFLHKCSICHKYVCEEHKYTRSGRAFCSSFCAAYFFHEGDEDD
jgi:hypothetical protein